MKKSDIQIAKNLLGQNNFVCVIVKNGEILFSSSKKGIQPFFDALARHDREKYQGCSIADRVIGKAALMLAAYLGAKEVYSPLASQHAIDVSCDLSLNLEAEKVVPYIINRTNDGMCPMEKAVLDIIDPEKAYETLENKLQELKLG
ncbi:MAG: DUF1893 domain-containing protein [Candidatus Marinimicrobia bacterium]|nr:DUF1893 domain-containing protein [Candidatus Neomarinimicrobiota bacterium]